MLVLEGTLNETMQNVLTAHFAYNMFLYFLVVLFVRICFVLSVSAV